MKAIVIGATGAVGQDLVAQLLEHPSVSSVIVLGRRNYPLNHSKLTSHCIDFEKPDEWQHLVQGDILFETMGTTLQQAGSKTNQWKIDHDYQYNIASIAQKNGIPKLILVSSQGANAKSSIFYNQMKGALEEAVKKLGFESLVIFRPSILIRKQSQRLGETLAVKVIRFLNKLGLLKKIQPMPTDILAHIMIHHALTHHHGTKILENKDIFDQQTYV